MFSSLFFHHLSVCNVVRLCNKLKLLVRFNALRQRNPIQQQIIHKSNVAFEAATKPHNHTTTQQLSNTTTATKYVFSVLLIEIIQMFARHMRQTTRCPRKFHHTETMVHPQEPQLTQNLRRTLPSRPNPHKNCIIHFPWQQNGQKWEFCMSWRTCHAVFQCKTVGYAHSPNSWGFQVSFVVSLSLTWNASPANSKPPLSFCKVDSHDIQIQPFPTLCYWHFLTKGMEK